MINYLLYTSFTPVSFLQNDLLNSQHENTNSKGVCAQKPVFNVRFKDFLYTIIKLSQKYIYVLIEIKIILIKEGSMIKVDIIICIMLDIFLDISSI